MSALQKFIHLALACALILFVFGRIFQQDINIQPDSVRYMRMGLNVANQVLSTFDESASNAQSPMGYGMGGPFAAFEIGLAAIIDPATRTSLECFEASKSLVNDCQMNITTLIGVYGFETLIFHICVGLVAYLVFGNSITAWIAVALSLGFKETRIYATSVLTEPSYMMTGGLFVLAWVYCWKYPHKIKPWFICGLFLGLLILSKPSWQALLPVLLLLIVIYGAWKRSFSTEQITPFVMLTIGAVLIFGPLIVRNGLALDIWSLSNPRYASEAMSHRSGYNFMSWGEWAVGWLYYLPDFGDSLAASLFGKPMVDKLDYGPDSYYVYGRDVLRNIAVNTADGHIVRFLLENYFFNDIVKATAVSLLLTWRGIFVGSLMGFIALLLSVPILYFQPANVRKLIFAMTFPLLIIAGVQALVSINTIRYNLLLAIPYSLILAQALYVLGKTAVGYTPSSIQTKVKRLISGHD